MCNVYLHRLDREWDDRDGVLCRYADDRAPRARLEVAM
jgi:RNA-directed DNA polymerase